MPPDYFEEEEFETKFTGTTFRRILGLLRPHWKIVVAFLIMIAITAGMDSLFTFVTKHIIDDGIMAKNLPALYRLLAIYAGMTVMQSFWVFGFIYSVGVLGERVRYDLRQMMFNHLQELSLSYYSRTPVGWIMSRVTSDSDRVADLITWGLLDITWAATSVISSLIFMLFINWKLALIVLVMVPVLVVVAVEFRKRILKEFRNVRKINSKITGQFNENITGVRVVKALVREDENAREFGVLTGDMYKAAYRAAWLSALFLPTVQLIAAFAIGAIAWYGGLQAQVGLLTIGGIQAFVSYVTFMMWPIQDMARIFAEMQHAIASAERIFSLVDAVPDVANREGAFDPGTIKGDIEFDHVTFYYEEDVPVLTDFNLKVKRGETIALVGPTGAGKTTIVNLLTRFYDIDSGSITVDGIDIRRLKMADLRRELGIVLQDTYLFSDTVMENIRYGRLDATDDEVIAAAKLANADQFIHRLPEGYQTQLSERAGNISQGQRQLLAIARAILADPSILILDEATSSVDTRTEKNIQEAMLRLMEGRTSFVIAHRLSTIRDADAILVINDGEIIERGTHDALLAQRGFYYHLYMSQFKGQHEVTPELAA